MHIIIEPVSTGYMQKRRCRRLMKKKIPIFRSDKEAEAFGAYEDMSSHDLSGGEYETISFVRNATRFYAH